MSSEQWAVSRAQSHTYLTHLRIEADVAIRVSNVGHHPLAHGGACDGSLLERHHDRWAARGDLGPEHAVAPRGLVHQEERRTVAVDQLDALGDDKREEVVELDLPPGERARDLHERLGAVLGLLQVEHRLSPLLLGKRVLEDRRGLQRVTQGASLRARPTACGVAASGTWGCGLYTTKGGDAKCCRKVACMHTHT